MFWVRIVFRFAVVVLLQGLRHGRIGAVDLFVYRTGGGKLVLGVRRVQVPPQVCQGVGDPEAPVFQTHHLKDKKKNSEMEEPALKRRTHGKAGPSRCAAWAAGCSQPE